MGDETVSSYVVQADLKPTNFLLQPSKYPDYRCVLPYQPLAYSVDHTKYFKWGSNELGCSADQGLFSVSCCVSNISIKRLESCQQGEKVIPVAGQQPKLTVHREEARVWCLSIQSEVWIWLILLTKISLTFYLDFMKLRASKFCYSLRCTLWGSERPDLLHGMLSRTVLL